MQRLATAERPHPFINTLVQTFRRPDKLYFLLEFVQVALSLSLSLSLCLLPPASCLLRY